MKTKLNTLAMARKLTKRMSPSQKAHYRKMYLKQKAENQNLDEAVQELTDEIKDGFHESDSSESEST